MRLLHPIVVKEFDPFRTGNIHDNFVNLHLHSLPLRPEHNIIAKGPLGTCDPGVVEPS